MTNFQFMTSVRVLLPDENTIVPDSLNPGEVGGDIHFSDGIWPDVGAEGFIMTPSMFYTMPVDVGEGINAFDFNVTPLAGDDIAMATGALCNFEIVVNEDTQIGIGWSAELPHHTYFSDSNSGSTYFWADTTNSVSPQIDVL
jgi:hypothetical protein